MTKYIGIGQITKSDNQTCTEMSIHSFFFKGRNRDKMALFQSNFWEVLFLPWARLCWVQSLLPTAPGPHTHPSSYTALSAATAVAMVTPGHGAVINKAWSCRGAMAATWLAHTNRPRKTSRGEEVADRQFERVAQLAGRADTLALAPSGDALANV